MKRREFIGLLGGAAAVWPSPMRAQKSSLPALGVLSLASSKQNAPFTASFIRGLSEAGFAEGQNVVIEYRWAEGQYDRLPAFAADLVRRPVAVIFASGERPRCERQWRRPVRSRLSSPSVPIQLRKESSRASIDQAATLPA